MPLIRVETNQALPSPQKLLPALSRAVAELIGKPEQYVQAIVHQGKEDVRMLHGGAEGPAAFVEVRSIGGLSAKVNRALSEKICALLAEQQISADRVYLNFIDVPATHWGHDGATFG